MNNKQIKAILMKAGFTEKDQGNGRMDLHPYVYDAARSLLTAQLAELGWLPCSPELLESGVDCAKAPRVLGSQGISHYHQAVQQHQGEPVAYLCKSEGAKWLQYGSKIGDPWKPGEVEVMPLHTHADPTEVERLRDELERRRTRGRNCANKVATLRAQLALLDLAMVNARKVAHHYHSGNGMLDFLDAEVKSLAAGAERNPPSPDTGYSGAFYEVCKLVGVVGARPSSPMSVFRDEVVPALEALRKDAERYRSQFSEGAWDYSEEWICEPKSQVDSMIDEAMAKGGE